MDFRELQVFAAVVRHRGITAAADALGVSKSAVSMQITRFEKRLGTRLLERSSRRVALTREGQQVLPRVHSLLSEAENLLEESASTTVIPSGTVRVAVTPALGGAVLEYLVPALRSRYPDISLVVLPSYELEDLQDPGFDFAIRVGQIRDEGLVANKVGQFVRILVCAPDHPAANLPCVEALRAAPLLSFSERSTHVDWQLHKAGSSVQNYMLDAEAAIAIRDFDLLLRLARQGHGVACLPDFMVRDDLASGRLSRLLPEWRSSPVDVMIAYRFRVSRISRVAVVLEEARRAAARVLQGEDTSSKQAS